MANLPWEVKYKGDGINVLIYHQDSIFNISQIIYDIQFTSSLNEISNLKLSLLKDPEDKLKIDMGDTVTFIYQDWKVFKGRILHCDINEKGNCEITAYDQIFYLKKNHIYTSFSMPRISDVFNFVKNQLSLSDNDIDMESILKLDQKNLVSKTFCDESYLDILLFFINRRNENSERLMSQTTWNVLKLNKVVNWVYLLDVFGKLTLRNISEIDDLSKIIIIGENSLLNSYNYNIDISENTYNKVLLFYSDTNNNSKDKISEVVSISNNVKTEDKENIKKWGYLCLFQNIQDKLEQKLIDDYAERLFNLKNVPKKTMTIEALGYNNIYAGTPFILHLPSLTDTDLLVYSTNVIHRWRGDLHTMEMQIQTSDNFPSTYGGNV